MSESYYDRYYSQTFCPKCKCLLTHLENSLCCLCDINDAVGPTCRFLMDMVELYKPKLFLTIPKAPMTALRYIRENW